LSLHSYRPSLSEDLEEKVQSWIDSTDNGITEKNKAIEKLVKIGLNEHTTDEKAIEKIVEEKLDERL